MQSMVIVCDPDGTAQHTLKDSFLNPFPGRQRSVNRMTHVQFSEHRQKFCIQFIRTDKGRMHYLIRDDFDVDTQMPLSPRDFTLLLKHMKKTHDDYQITSYENDGGILYFDTYEHAVTVELFIVDMLRRRGFKLYA